MHFKISNSQLTTESEHEPVTLHPLCKDTEFRDSSRLERLAVGKVGHNLAIPSPVLWRRGDMRKA